MPPIGHQIWHQAANLSPLLGQAKLWIHGHCHDFFNYDVAGTRVAATRAVTSARTPGSIPRSWSRYLQMPIVQEEPPDRPPYEEELGMEAANPII